MSQPPPLPPKPRQDVTVPSPTKAAELWLKQMSAPMPPSEAYKVLARAPQIVHQLLTYVVDRELKTNAGLPAENRRDARTTNNRNHDTRVMKPSAREALALTLGRELTQFVEEIAVDVFRREMDMEVVFEEPIE